MTGELHLSVVIPTRGRSALLAATLRSLITQDYWLQETEIVVVLDGDDPGTREVASRLEGDAAASIVVLRQPRRGQGAARNLGIRHARGRVVLMLDDDIIAEPSLFGAHMEHHAAGADRAVIGAVPVEEVGDEPAHHRAFRLWWDEALEELATNARRPEFRDFTTGNVSLPREWLSKVGGFDQEFAGYGREDYELGHRLRSAGLPFVHEPRARGYHRYGKPVREWLRQFRPQGRADVLFARKHPEIVGEIMTLSPFPQVPWNRHAVAAGERAVERLNRRGGAAWKYAAALTQAAYYWRGVREEARTAAEYRHLVQSQIEALRQRNGSVGRVRLGLARAATAESRW